MYIWIFLATIMVALSFFNLSPRPEADNSANEVKASITVNRFRAEHLAFVRTMECEVILRCNNGYTDLGPGWHQGDNSVVIDKTFMNTLPYTDFATNLPIGYEEDTNLLDVHHVIACTKKRLEDTEGSNSFVQCNKYSYKYAVSYTKIPDRWLSKDVDATGVVKPLPALVNLISKASSAGSIYGWADCSYAAGGMRCILRGYSAKVSIAEQTEDDEIIQKYTHISPQAIIWNTPDFLDECRDATHPCLFAYERFMTSDKGHHCKTLMGDYYPYSDHYSDQYS